MIKEFLFKTGAVMVSNHTEPFWYASGTFGPFFINTHYLFGSETEAKAFLNIIDRYVSDKDTAPSLFCKIVKQQYEKSRIYKKVIDTLIRSISDRPEIEKIDYISGGERRDWFFSYITAILLDKPHITLFKDLSSNVIYKDTVTETPDLSGKRFIHICDLVTLASSYIKSWIPALEKYNGKLQETFTIVDRCQGGKDILAQQGIRLHSLADIDENLFIEAKNQFIINAEQLDMVLSFIKDPDQFMQDFIRRNPEFLSRSVEKGGKDKERAEAFMKQFYKR
jgi:orotate phosphoribosyltransferase